MIVNYFPNSPSEKFLNNVVDYSDKLNYILKERILYKFKYLYGNYSHHEDSKKLNNIITLYTRGFSMCRYCGCANGSIEWYFKNGDYHVPEGIIHTMEKHNVYPVLLYDNKTKKLDINNEDNYILSEYFINYFLREKIE